MNYDIILWDIDRTLLDPIQPERNAIQVAFREFGLGVCSEAQLDLYPAINDKWWDKREKGLAPKEEILWRRFEEFLTVCNVDSSSAYEFSRCYMSHLGDTISFKPHAIETLSSLQGKVKQYVVTNGATLSQEKKLQGSGIDRYMDGVFISEELGADKPSKAFFDGVFSVLGDVDRSRVLIVGDSLTTDMPGGVNAGIKTCWYNPEGKKNSFGLALDYVIRDLSEVVEIVG